eukprot:3287361-Rhodomonas_salina.1
MCTCATDTPRSPPDGTDSAAITQTWSEANFTDAATRRIQAAQPRSEQNIRDSVRTKDPSVTDSVSDNEISQTRSQLTITDRHAHCIRTKQADAALCKQTAQESTCASGACDFKNGPSHLMRRWTVKTAKARTGWCSLGTKGAGHARSRQQLSRAAPPVAGACCPRRARALPSALAPASV